MLLRILLALLLMVAPASAQFIFGGGSSGGGSGTVTTLSVATANGFAGTVATATTTPVITLTTSVTGNVCSNATALSACSTTGTGSTVLATSPTLTTPALGVAVATSLAIGGATIGTNALAVTGNGTLSGALTLGTSGILVGGTNLITQRNGTNAQTFSLYNTFTDASNGEWLSVDWVSTANRATIKTTNNGTGTGRSLEIIAASNLNIGGGGSTSWQFDTASNLTPITNNSVNIGYASQQVKNIFIGTGVVFGAGSQDTTISRNAAGIIQFGTTAANASGAWLAAKGTLTGGTLADQAQVLAITATQPASPTGSQNAMLLDITGAGSANQLNIAQQIRYLAGYTGAAGAIGFLVNNSNASTGTTLNLAVSLTNPAGNSGFNSVVSGTTAGTNYGGYADVGNGNVNIGLVGKSVTTKNSATNIGGIFTAINAGTTPVQIGLFAGLGITTLPAVSAALIVDNGAQTDPIFLARDNGSTVFTIAGGGAVTSTLTISAGTRLQSTTDIILGTDNNAARFLQFGTNRAAIDSPSDGVLRIANSAQTDFSRLQFGGTTSSFPSIKRSTTSLQVRLADDSADAGITMSTIGASGIVTVSNATDSTTTTSGSLQVAGGMAVRKRIFADGLTASAGLQTAVICQSSAGELIADSVACLASSARFKTILGYAEVGAIDKIMRLPIYRWKYNEEGIFKSDGWTRERIGPTAEEIVKIDPRLVGYDNEGRVRNISTEQLLSLTIQAVQELKADNDNLRATLTKRAANGG